MPGFNFYLQPGTAEFGATLPGNAQALLDYCSANILIVGADNVGGLNFGYTTPPPENRDFPWWRTDADGNPMGMYSWNGSAWVTTPNVVPNGPTTSRPLNPTTGMEYLDTTINRLLIFERGQWRTADGCVGELREVLGSTIEAVLAMNPGWAEHTASQDKVIAGASATNAPASTVGEEEVTLGINQMPSHFHQSLLVDGSEDDNGDPGPLIVTQAASPIGIQTSTNSKTGSTGGGEAHNNMQPTFYAFRIYKT